MAEHTRCRICTSNDEDALVDHIAGAIWESRRHGSLDDQQRFEILLCFFPIDSQDK